jgi:predicted  nucleic acid-binding Zn-ribbon protein
MPNEYEEILDICPDCGTRLMYKLPEEETPQYTELTTVFTTADAGLLALAKSILDDAGIDFYVRGESTKMLFAAGFMELQVHPDDADEAEMLMGELGRTGDRLNEEDEQ